MAVTDIREPQHPEDRTVAALVQDLSQQTAELVREEMALARAELQEKGKRAGLGVGLISSAGLLAFFGGSCLVTAVILALSLAMTAWLAALVTALVMFGAAGVAVLVGRNQVRRATPPKPGQMIENLPRDIEAVKQPIKERSHS